jgi:hypothetical protein
MDKLPDMVGRVISETPYVKLLAQPRLQAYELVPGMIVDRWEAVAQVDTTVAIVELKVTL